MVSNFVVRMVRLNLLKSRHRSRNAAILWELLELRGFYTEWRRSGRTGADGSLTLEGMCNLLIERYNRPFLTGEKVSTKKRNDYMCHVHPKLAGTVGIMQTLTSNSGFQNSNGS